MPLSALANGAVVIAPLVSQAAWDGLAASVRRGETELVIGACGHPARMRRSKLGTQHFFHRRPEACGTAPESPAHLQAKAQIVLGCQAAGWDVETEARGAEWRADVLASRGRHRVAFEVQLSRQSWEETVARTKRYEQSGIRACWLLRHYPMKTPVTKEIPAFHIVRRDIVPDRTSPFGKEIVGDVPGYVACIEGL